MADFGDLLAHVPKPGHNEVFEALVSTPNIRIERILSHGHHSPEGFWYQQDRSEWVLLIQGRATLRFEQGPVHELFAGCYVLIPAGVRHRVDWSDPDQTTLWLAIHFSP